MGGDIATVDCRLANGVRRHTSGNDMMLNSTRLIGVGVNLDLDQQSQQRKRGIESTCMISFRDLSTDSHRYGG